MAMTTQAFAVFNVFVPKGSGITADDLVSGNEIASAKATGTFIMRVFEYIDLQKVKTVCVRGNHFIITTGDVFCCGHHYTDVNAYKKMVNSIFPSSNYRVFDINKIHDGKTKQKSIDSATITWTPSIYYLDEHIRWWVEWATENNVQQLYVNPDVAIEKQMKVIAVVSELPVKHELSAEVATGVSVDNPVVVPVASAASVVNPVVVSDAPTSAPVVVPDAPAIAPVVVPDASATNLTTTPPDNADTSSTLLVKICPDVTIPAWCGQCQKWH